MVAVAWLATACAPSPSARKPEPELDDVGTDVTAASARDSIADVVEDTADAAPIDATIEAPPLVVLPPMTEADVVVHRDLKIGAVDTCATPDVPVEGSADIGEATDVEYASMGGESQTLDIAWPKAPGPHPLVVIIHGGGWSAGTKQLYRKDTRRLASIGYVAATIEYRLCNKPKNRFPAGMIDARCAVRWLRSRAATYGIDRTRVVALGASAGGHMAAMLGVEPEMSLLDGDCPVKDQPVSVSGVAAYYAPVDLRTPSKTYKGIMVKGVEEFFGKPAEEVQKMAILASPMAHVDKNDPPFLLLHGVEDSIIPIEESRRFVKLLKKAKVPAFLLEIDGDKGMHGFPILVTTRPKVSCTTLAFIAAATK
jgi:acetyl esterase/lipase